MNVKRKLLLFLLISPSSTMLPAAAAASCDEPETRSRRESHDTFDDKALVKTFTYGNPKHPSFEDGARILKLYKELCNRPLIDGMSTRDLAKSSSKTFSSALNEYDLINLVEAGRSLHAQEVPLAVMSALRDVAAEKFIRRHNEEDIKVVSFDSLINQGDFALSVLKRSGAIEVFKDKQDYAQFFIANALKPKSLARLIDIYRDVQNKSPIKIEGSLAQEFGPTVWTSVKNYVIEHKGEIVGAAGSLASVGAHAAMSAGCCLLS